MSDIIPIRHNGQVVDRVQHPPLPLRYRIAATVIAWLAWLWPILPWLIAIDIAITVAVITIMEVT